MGFVQRRLVKLVLCVVAWPKVTVGLCALGLAGAVLLALTSLSLSTNQNELMTPHLGFFKDYLEFVGRFPESECFVVVVEPVNRDHPPASGRWMELADRLAAGLRGLPGEVQRVDWRVAPAELGDQALLLADWEEIRQQSAEMKRFQPLLKIVGEKPGLDALIHGRTMTERLVTNLGRGKPAESKEFVTLVAKSLDAALAQAPDKWSKGQELPDLASLDPQAKSDGAVGANRAGYFVMKDREVPRYSILLVNVYAKRDYSKLSDVTGPLLRMRATVAEVAKEFADFHVGVTGRPALEADEMRTSDRDTRMAEILGLSLVFIALLIFLRSLWLAVAAELCLGVGIGWTFGWASLPWPVGRLNLLSLVFVIALIGIGMDYLIQILMRYRYEKKRYERHGAIWARVFRYVSAPISTACAGAAGAFLVATLTDFRGAAELGIIAGGGLLLCLLSGYTLLPALLTLFPANVGKVAEENRYTHRLAPPGAGGWRMIVPGVWILLAVGGLWLALPPRFDPNLLGLQAQGLESVQLVRKISTWSAVVMSDDLGKLRAVRDAVMPGRGEASTIGRSESVLDLYDKQRWLAENMKSLGTIAWYEPPAATRQDAQAIAASLHAVVDDWKRRGVDMGELPKYVTAAGGRLSGEGVTEETLGRLTAWQRAMMEELKANAGLFLPHGVDINRLPAPVRDHLVSATPGGGKAVYALYIYPHDDAWDTSTLEAFVKEVRLRAPAAITVTGIAPQLYESTNSIHKAFLQSTVYALVLIFGLVWLDLRSVAHTLLAVSVLGLGLPMLLLVMWLWRALGNPWGINGSWNFANFFGLPILIGAGHEYGVFMIHRYREVLHDPKRVWRVWDVSDRALLLCAIVTTCSFGFLMIADHRGLRSLGWVMAMGSACIYLSSLLVLRPILQWRLRQKDVYGSK